MERSQQPDETPELDIDALKDLEPTDEQAKATRGGQGDAAGDQDTGFLGKVLKPLLDR